MLEAVDVPARRLHGAADHLRDAFRAGDVWLARSRRYGDTRKAPLSAPVVYRSMPLPANPQDWLAERKFALDEGLRTLDAAA